MQKSFPRLLIALAPTAQILPHPFNVSPVAALGLFAGTQLQPRKAWAVPTIALLAGHIVNGFYALPVRVWVYADTLAGPLFGRLLLAGRRSPARFVGDKLAARPAYFSWLRIWASGWPVCIPRIWRA